MPLVSQLDFRHPAALFLGDGSGVAVIIRNTPAASGPGWARTAEPGAGVAAPYLYLAGHAVETAVYAVDGAAPAEPVADPHLDARLRSIGQRFESADIDRARREDAAAGDKMAASRTAIRTAAFAVDAFLDGHLWSADVGPNVDGETTLVLSNNHGTVRHVVTAVPRADLERARAEAVRVDAVEWVRRGWWDPRPGRRPRTLRVQLLPSSPPSRPAP